MEANVSQSFTTIRTISHLTRYFVEQEIQFVRFQAPVVNKYFANANFILKKNQFHVILHFN